MEGNLVKVVVVFWTVILIGLACYLMYFPIFMKKNMAELVALLKRIAEGVENKSRKNE